MGGVDLVEGMDFQGSYISKIFYVKTKESGPLGGHAPGTPPPLDPPMPPLTFDALAFKTVVN